VLRCHWGEGQRGSGGLVMGRTARFLEVREGGQDVSAEFSIGDKAVYPSQGVAEIVGIEKKEIFGKIQSFYVLRAMDNGLRILVPTDKAEQVGLRPIAGQDEIKEVMQILRDKEIHIDRQTWNRRYRGFMEKIKSGSLFEVAEVFRDLYRLKGLKPLSFGERRMLDTARGLIVQELSVARASDSRKVEQELDRLFN
jgi:CarD family transcriptional regulator